MDDDRYEIRLSGSGGQGMILASVILAEAATLEPENYVCQTQSYGPEARGGKCKAEVIIGKKNIDYPKVIKLDMLLAMNQESCDAYFYDFKPNGLLLVDSTFVEQIPTSRVIAIPFTQLARETAGGAFAANMVALGAIGQLCPVVTLKNLEAALAARLPADSLTANRKAFKAGVAAVRQVKLKKLPRSIKPQDEEEI